MIWARRVFAVLIIPLFLVSFIVSLVLLRVNETFLNGNFYVEQLRKADFYNFLYDTAVPSGFDEATKDVDTQGVDVKKIKADVLPAIEKAFPPEWLQAQTEGVILAVFPYFTGDTDEFSVTIDLNSRIDPTASAIKDVLRGPAFDSLYNELTFQLADTAVDNLDELPAGIKLTQDDMLSAIRTIAPKAWLVARIENALDKTTPYVKGTSQHFTITIPLNDRVEAAGTVLKDILRKSDAYTFMLDTVVDTLVSSTTNLQTQLPYGITITRQDIYDAVKQVVPREWVQARFDNMTDSSVAYLTGKSNTLSVTIPLADRREAAYQALASLADRKLEQTLTALPQCSLIEFGSVILTLQPGQLPRCRPAGVSYAQAKQLLNIDAVALVRAGLGEQIPNAWTFSEAELRDMAGEDLWDNLQDARKWVTKGYTYNDADLRDKLNADQEKTLDRVLKHVRQGATFTHEDMRKFISDAEDGQEILDKIDQARSGLHMARQWIWLLWVWLALLLAAIGFLGGRNWGSRLTWAAAVLVPCALLMMIVTAAAYGAVAQPAIQDAFDEAIADARAESPTAALALDKAADIVISVADDFVGGIRNKAILLLALGLLGMGVGITRQVLHKQAVPAGLSPEQTGEAPPPPSPAPPKG